jgi:tetratricopeptide (TPR) repeat protein
VTIGEDLGYEPNEPVRVEILSHPSDLARVSTLTAGEIETTGTIALCKYNKLMVVTPRATVLGYKWMDTMVHEYVHYAVSRASNDAVPVWLQEGLARFEQTRWREEPNTRLSGIEENLLATALADGKLVTFDEMHPSMAKLPDAETAALAFAEVYTMVGYLHGERGYEGLREIIALQKSGKSARRAVAEVMGERFGSVEKSWRAALRKRKLEKNAALAGHTGRARLRKGDLDATRDDDNAGVDTVANDRAQKFARLGGILRSRGMPEAAVVEYEKAHAVAANDPFVVGKLARTYVELGKHERAIELAEPMLSADDSDSALPTTLGMAYMAAKRAEDAAGAFEVALRVSPFDPAVRCGLAKAYSESGSAALAKRERKACDTLTDGKAVNTWTRIR